MDLIFIPENHLEETLIMAKKGEVDIPHFLDELKSNEIYIPSMSEADEYFQPMVFEREHGRFVAIFTAQSRLSPFLSIIRFHLKANAKEFFSKLSSDYGVVVNPGWSIGCEIDGKTITTLLRFQSLNFEN